MRTEPVSYFKAGNLYLTRCDLPFAVIWLPATTADATHLTWRWSDYCIEAKRVLDRKFTAAPVAKHPPAWRPEFWVTARYLDPSPNSEADAYDATYLERERPPKAVSGPFSSLERAAIVLEMNLPPEFWD